MDVTIRGIQEAQRANLEVIKNLQPGGAFGRAIQYGTIEAHRYAVSITHVQTGALRASHRMEVSGLEGRIFIDPTSENPRGGRPEIYGPIEEARGGEHAFYARTEAEAGYRIAQAAGEGFIRDIQ